MTYAAAPATHAFPAAASMLIQSQPEPEQQQVAAPVVNSAPPPAEAPAEAPADAPKAKKKGTKKKQKGCC
jgi:hypothetical protein